MPPPDTWPEHRIKRFRAFGFSITAMSFEVVIMATMKILRSCCLMFVLAVGTLVRAEVGSNTIFPVESSVTNQLTDMDRAVEAIVRSLPAGWSLAERKSDEIPWGHHWSEKYAGPRGTLLTVRGVLPVNMRFYRTNDTSQLVGSVEALELWLMPSNYSNPFSEKFSIHRPVQPTVITEHGPVKVYARPTGFVISRREVDELLRKSKGVGGCESPWNEPKMLTWKGWKSGLKKAIETEFSKKARS